MGNVCDRDSPETRRHALLEQELPPDQSSPQILDSSTCPMEQVTRILFEVLQTGDIKSAKSFLHVNNVGDLDILGMLLDKGVSVNAQNMGWPLLHHVVNSRIESPSNIEVIKFLLDRGADINMGGKGGTTALQLAIERRGRDAVIRLLLDRGANVNVQDCIGWSPLHYLVHNRVESTINVELAKLLIDRGAEVGMQSKDGSTALHLAVKQHKSEFIKLLLDRGASVNAQNRLGSPLHYVVKHRVESGSNVEFAKLLIERGAEVSLQGRYGKTALHLAIENQKRAFMRLLLNNVADVNVQDGDGQSALHSVVTHFDEYKDGVEVTKWIIEKGSDIDLQDEDGNTALDVAIMRNNMDITRLLLDCGASVDVQDNDGCSALHHIADCADVPSDIITMILSRSLNVNVQDDKVRTPIHLVVQKNDTTYLSALLDWGGSMMVKDDDGVTPLSSLLSNLNENLALKNVLLHYVQRVKCARLVNDVELLNIDDDDDDSGYQTILLQEIEMMKQGEGGWSSVYDVFSKYPDPLYVSNRDLQAVIESAELENRFSMYCELLKATFAKAKRRLVLLDKAVGHFEVNLPVEVKRKILSYLDSSDIQCLINCYEQVQV